MSDPITTSNGTSGDGASYTSQPFRTANTEAHSPERHIPQQKPSAVTIGVTANSHEDPITDAVREEKGNIANDFFELGTPFRFLPTEMQDKLSSIDEYIETQMSDKSMKHTLSNYTRVLDGVIMDMMAGEDYTVNDKIDLLSGYARNMMKLDGLSDISDSIKASLKRKKSAKDMDRLILREIGKRIL